jgi:AAA domain
MTIRAHSPSANRYAKHLYFAPAGRGKTHLLGTAQEDDRTYPIAIVDWEAGTESLEGLDIDIFSIRSWDDANKLIECFEEGGEHKIGDEWYDFDAYKSVGIDSISEWYRSAQLERLKKVGESRKEPDLVEYQDYNILTTQFRRVLRRFRDLPMHVFFSAHSKTIEDPRQGRVTLPDLPGQLAEEVAGLVSLVGYLAETTGDDPADRLLLLHGYPKYRIKARSPWNIELPEEIEDPDITAILDELNFSHNHR